MEHLEVRQPHVHRPARWRPLILALIVAGVCYSGSSPSVAVIEALQGADAVAAPAHGPTPPVAAGLARASRSTGWARDPEASPGWIASLAVDWRGSGTAVLTSTELPRDAVGTRWVRWSAPYDGQCSSATWHLDGSGALRGAQPWRVTNLRAGRCYRWSVAVRAGAGSTYLAASAPIGISWTSGPRGWSTGERNHFWFPALGISQRVHAWPCPRDGKLANVVYDWGCAGPNNRYLTGHAYGVFRPIFLAVERHGLQVGQVAWVADANGHLIRYRLVSYVVMLKTDAWDHGQWTFEGTPTPVLTVQTCYGARNDRFVFVRFAPA